MSGEYNKPLQRFPKIYYRSSEFLENVYKPNQKVEYVKIDSNTKILYIPTAFSANMRYSPFRDRDDIDYACWQKVILKKFPKITYKAHPNSLDLVKFYIGKLNNMISVNLKNCITQDDYDLFIIDYFSTAIALAVATIKPIIYLDLGLMNIHPQTIEDLQKRCCYYKIDWNKDFNEQIQAAIEKYNQTSTRFENTYTPKYSLTSQKQNFIELVRIIIDENYK